MASSTLYILGRGAFGQVLLCRGRKSGELVAIKGVSIENEKETIEGHWSGGLLVESGGHREMARDVRRLLLQFVLAVPILLVLLYREFFGVLLFETTASPRNGELPYGEEDDLGNGKYCKRKRGMLRRRTWWHCQECEDGQCKALTRRGRCKPFAIRAFSPRAKSEYSPYTHERSTTLVFTHNGHERDRRRGGDIAQHGTPACSTLTLPCFNISRCGEERSGPQPIKVYAYKTITNDTRCNLPDYIYCSGSSNLDYAANKYPEVVTRVDHPDEACLLVVGRQTFDSPEQLVAQDSWNHGMNHYIYRSQQIFGNPNDRPFNTVILRRGVNFGLASTSSYSVDDAINRDGFDLPTALLPKWRNPKPAQLKGDLHSQRRFVLSFKGTVHDWEELDWQYRWIASEYWFGDDVHVDSRCRETFSSKLSQYTDEIDYVELLLSSTFVFAPGGGSVNSFRFGEALQAGAIPVVTSNYVPPFHPDVDWNGCIVRVSDARVVDTPRIVRSIPPEEVKSRQRVCSRLTEKVNPKLYGDDYL